MPEMDIRRCGVEALLDPQWLVLFYGAFELVFKLAFWKEIDSIGFYNLELLFK
jgi:hypothetical protein